jgi:hypothetical protein
VGLAQGPEPKKRMARDWGLDGFNLEELGLQDRLMGGSSVSRVSHVCERRGAAFSGGLGGSPARPAIGWREDLSAGHRAKPLASPIVPEEWAPLSGPSPKNEGYPGGSWCETPARFSLSLFTAYFSFRVGRTPPPHSTQHT